MAKTAETTTKVRNRSSKSTSVGAKAGSSARPAPKERPTGWTFFTNHAHVLFTLATDPDIRMRDVAEAVGITERAVHRILHELEAAGYLEIVRVGRRNTYVVNDDGKLRHPIEANVSVQELVRLLKRAKKRDR